MLEAERATEKARFEGAPGSNPTRRNRHGRPTASRRYRWLLPLAVVVTAALWGGCARTSFYERERIADHAMTFEADAGLVYIRNKIEAAREGAFGGFGGSAAGGCGCQ